MRRSIAQFVLIMVMVLFATVHIYAQFFSGATFEDRRQAYINNQGHYWENNVPQDYPHYFIQCVWAWLERGTDPDKVSEEIGFLTYNHPDGQNDNDSYPYNNYWNAGDQPAKVMALRILLQYRDKISESDAQKILNRESSMPNKRGAFSGGTPNFAIRSSVAAYLYLAHYGDPDRMVLFPETNDSGWPPEFTYKGHHYVPNTHYPGLQLFYDWLNWYLDHMVSEGTDEDFGSYYHAQTQAVSLLYDFCPEAFLKRKAKMVMDFLLLNAGISFSANQFGGGHGRMYAILEGEGTDYFPWYMYWNFGTTNIVTRYNRPFTETFVSGYRMPELIEELIEMKGEGEDYYRIVRGYNPSLKTTTSIHSYPYRYVFVTPYYNLGGAGEGSGWELNIKADKVPFKLWIDNEQTVDADGYLGSRGKCGAQDKNAMFVRIGNPQLHVLLGQNNWSSQREEGDWQFFRKDSVVVAVNLGSSSAALEVCTIGVDYPTYADFREAIESNARLEVNRFVTSKGREITEEFVHYGDDYNRLPFDRLEAWDNEGNKIIDWNNNVMTVEYKGRTLSYNFRSWRLYEDGNPVMDYDSPAPPTSVSVTQIN